MRKKSENKCYSADMDKYGSSRTLLSSYPKIPSNEVNVIDSLCINTFDEYSGHATATMYENYTSKESPENENDGFYATVDLDKLMNSEIDKLSILLNGIISQTSFDKVYKYNYELLSMYLSGEIDKITVYCKGLAAEVAPYDYPLHGRYIIVICGYLDNKCKIDYEVLTYHCYVMHPSRILHDIKSKAKSQNLNVEINEDSFKSAIELLKKDNPLDRERFTQEDLLRQLEILDTASK